MEKWVFSCCLMLLSYPGLARAQSQSPTPADTIPGQTQLTRSIAADACLLLATSSNPANSSVARSPVQAQEAFEKALSAAIEKRVASIKQVAQRAKTTDAYTKLRAELPTTVAVQLIRGCPAGAQLYSQFSNLAPAEEAFIKSWGEDLCQRLAALQAQGAMQGKTSAERVALFRQEFMASLNQRSPQIMRLYGAAGNSEQVVSRLGARVTEYMQQHCLQTLMLLKDSK